MRADAELSSRKSIYFPIPHFRSARLHAVPKLPPELAAGIQFVPARGVSFVFVHAGVLLRIPATCWLRTSEFRALKTAAQPPDLARFSPWYGRRFSRFYTFWNLCTQTFKLTEAKTLTTEPRTLKAFRRTLVKSTFSRLQRLPPSALMRSPRRASKLP